MSETTTWACAVSVPASASIDVLILKITGYLRYVDDFVLFATERQRLEQAREAIRLWLAEERGLALNPKHGQLRPARAPATFLGYRISRAGIAPSRKLRRRFRRRIEQAAAEGEEALERCLQSYAERHGERSEGA